MVLYMMAYMLTSVVEQSFFVYKACSSNHHLDDTICNNITADENEDYNKEVQVNMETVFSKAIVYYANIMFMLLPR